MSDYDPQAWNDETEMPFGKFRGKRLADVPASYLIWAAKQKDIEQRYPRLITYVNEIDE